MKVPTSIENLRKQGYRGCNRAKEMVSGKDSKEKEEKNMPQFIIRNSSIA